MSEVIVYGKPNCPQCEVAKNTLVSAGVSYDYVDVTSKDELRQFLISEGHRSVPQIYVNKKHVKNVMECVQLARATAA